MKRFALGILLALTCATCFAADPAPPSILPLAVQTAIDKLTADTKAFAANSGSLAGAQAAAAQAQANLAAIQSQTTALAAAIPQDQAAVTAAIQQAFGPVTPTPADLHPVQILEVGQTGCGPCDDLDPIVAKIRGSGVSITRVDIDKDPTAKAKWKPTATPTFVTLVDGAEVNRHVGALNEKQLTDWYADTKAWVAKKYPPHQ